MQENPIHRLYGDKEVGKCEKTALQCGFTREYKGAAVNRPGIGDIPKLSRQGRGARNRPSFGDLSLWRRIDAKLHFSAKQRAHCAKVRQFSAIAAGRPRCSGPPVQSHKPPPTAGLRAGPGLPTPCGLGWWSPGGPRPWGGRSPCRLGAAAPRPPGMADAGKRLIEHGAYPAYGPSAHQP